MTMPHEAPNVPAGMEDLESILRDLDAYARGTAHALPSGLVPRVLAAVAREAAPTPPVSFARAVAAMAPRDAARAFAGMVALIEGRRPAAPTLRLRAAAMVLATCLVVGAAGAGATFGGVQLVDDWFAPQATTSSGPTDLASPTPDGPASVTTREPAPSPRRSPKPEASGGPRETAEPSRGPATAEPSDKDDDSASQEPGDGPSPSDGDGEGGGGDSGGHSPGPTQAH
jgi:hypothetical protein